MTVTHKYPMPTVSFDLTTSGAFLGEDQAFRNSAQAISLLPGTVGDYVRREFYRRTLVECAPDAQIAFGTLFSSRNVRIGAHAYIGAHCMISDAVIGRDVLIGSNVHLLSGKAIHGSKELATPMRLQPGRISAVRIGDDTWIGNGAVVMADVGRQCVVGAGSVVVSDVPDRTIVGGNPARLIRRREGVAARDSH